MNPLSETKEVTTPSGEHTITHRAYLTGEDRRTNRRLLIRLSEEGKIRNAEAIEEAENALINQVILSVDGTKETIVEKVLQMRAEDYDFVIDLVNEIASGVDKKKEKTSDSSTKTSSTEEE